MNDERDPIRKPRRLRFSVSAAMIVTAPLLGAPLLGCGSEDPHVNVPETIHEPEERTNVAEEDPPPEEPEPEPDTNVVAPEEPEPEPNVPAPEPVEPRTNVVESPSE